MSNIKIPELPEVTSLQGSDLFVVETANGTKKLKKENLVTDTTVDPVPTEGSENAVASGGVYAALAGKEDTLTFDDTPTEDSNNPVKSSGLYSEFQAKQDKLTFDDVPVSGSNNPVKSSGIYNAIALKQDKLTFDSEPIENSPNPVTSGGLFAILQGKQEAPTVFDKILPAGQKTITFTHDIFAENISFDVLTDNINTIVVSANQDKANRTITIEILEAMDVDITVRLCISIIEEPEPPTPGDDYSNVNLGTLGNVLNNTGTNYILGSDTEPDPGTEVFVVSD